MMVWYRMSTQEVLDHFKINRNVGILGDDLPGLQFRFGKNILNEVKRKSFFSVFLRQFLSPLIYLLMIAAGISVWIGDVKDGLVITVVVILNSVIGAIQEGRAEQSLLSLRKMTKIKARVLRDGVESEIDSGELVPGDLFFVSAGDGVPTDARLMEATSLFVAEAALTGESLPIGKTSDTMRYAENGNSADNAVPLADRQNMIFAGTFITSGRGVAIAVSTGLQNEIGKIAQLASSVVQQKTKLEARIHQFGKYLTVAGLVLFLSVVLLGMLRGIPFSGIFMIAVSQMVSLVPEGLPVALTIALSVGVQRMSRRKTVVRRLSAVESLGSTTVICTDKTGTLTKNEMTVVRIYFPSTHRHLELTGVGYSSAGEFVLQDRKIPIDTDEMGTDPEFLDLIHASVGCNDAALRPVDQDHHRFSILGDPTEAALLIMAEKARISVDQVRSNFPRISEIPFDSVAKLMATQHDSDGGKVIFIKGAPEALLPFSKLTPIDRRNVLEAAERMTESALRVLAIGMVEDESVDLSAGYGALMGQVRLIALIGQLDPPRSEVLQSVNECIQAGIRPMMITGDHRKTALAIGRQLGIATESDSGMDGHELDQMNDQELALRITRTNVFARVTPSHKLRIVKALQSAGQVVAMTGDGVNDAPALVQADVGVAMGITGTEVAKEASKIVIVDDNFSTIVAAVEEGRLVYQNIKKLILFLFVTSIDEVLILFLALLAGFPPPLAAVQILWINLVSEGALTINLIMEPAEGNEMNRPPIPLDEPLLDSSLLKRIPLMVITSVFSTFGWFYWRTQAGISPEVVQAETFTVLVVSQWFNALNCRSAESSVFSRKSLRNPWLWGGLLVANALHFLVIFWKPLSSFFHTVPISLTSFFMIGLVASLVLWVEELRKWWLKQKKHPSGCLIKRF
jgi:magnesium-transporting ATPase (P-type)